MENTNDPYIKLSRIRNDYGLTDRQGTNLKLSELDGFTPEQLRQLLKTLLDENQDIEYQINLELKRCEKNAGWMYGCKNSMKARNVFIDRINEILGDSIPKSEVAIRFMNHAKEVLSPDAFELILSQS